MLHVHSTCLGPSEGTLPFLLMPIEFFLMSGPFRVVSMHISETTVTSEVSGAVTVDVDPGRQVTVCTRGLVQVGVDLHQLAGHSLYNGIYTLHGTGTGTGTGIQWVILNYAEVFTLLRDRDRDLKPLCPIVPIPFPVPVPVPVPGSVYIP